MRAALLSALLLGSTTAWAGCDEVYTTDQLITDLVAIEGKLRGGEDAVAGTLAQGMEGKLACLDSPLALQIAGRALRAVGGGLYAAGNTERGQQWLTTAAEVENTFDYGLEDLPEEHPIRDVWRAVKTESSASEKKVGGKQFVEGKFLLDGRKLADPMAREGRPHVFQVEQGAVWESYVIEGNKFPSTVLTDKVLVTSVVEAPKKEPKIKEPKGPKEKKPKKPDAPAVANAYTSGGTTAVVRDRPREKTPLMIAGGAVLAGAGGIYYASMASRRNFDEATTREEVDQRFRQTNQLFLTSAAVAAIGAGTLTWGIILDGGTPLPGVHFKF